ncbi:MAG: hypothetical protein A2941_01125 [Candidatus Yanofskybacteria bacterium RIFCSPLOWO2_01_FULL_49_17]|uniref:Fibronectin type-III domain-containing protein n=1 Tax=Candidatus Yanofskybacteria bacterium RIFCSPLOWO2_01_FULL_49_17 TaxID=1802700 RepID=A0A1F8GQ86_9BACT|nr:MAG: hypothetical protein A2941_01125 [Candidatus Yanofskybacteria bacterium RIFCSPLOWO2_01_FULL_49_17]
MSINNVKSCLALALIIVFAGWPVFSFAEISIGASLSSDNFRVLDPQHSLFGGTASSSSSNFLLTATIGDLAIGSASATTFGWRSGFLYYPKVTAPTLNTATAGNGQVALSWTAAAAYQGWTIGGYNICHKSTGSYTCVDTSSTDTSATKTGLTNGTTYTFKIQAYDGLAAKNVIAESNEKTAAPAVTATPTPTPASGGGGGGYAFIATTPPGPVGVVVVSGISYPQSTVSIYNDGVLAASIKSDSGAKFQASITNIAVGTHTIGLNSQDANGQKSLTVSFVVNVVVNTTVSLTNILLPPTIDISATQLSRGDILNIFGQAQPLSEVNVHVFSAEVVNELISDNNGAYKVAFDTKSLEDAAHITKSRAIVNEVVSPFSSVLQFIIGKVLTKGGTSDVNNDSRVNIKDFSILLYWWNTKNETGLSKTDLNRDGKVNIVDFSIMLYQWTG